MNILKLIEILKLVAPLAGVDTAKLQVVLAILDLLKEETK
jgi:hypothetical protein